MYFLLGVVLEIFFIIFFSLLGMACSVTIARKERCLYGE